MREHDKIELRVLVKRVPPGRRREHVAVEKGSLGEQPLEILPHRLAPAPGPDRPLVRAAILAERIE